MNHLFFLLLLTLCIACNNTDHSEKSTDAADLENAIQQAESRRGADPAKAGGNRCLLGYQSGYDVLLTEAQVLSATGFSSDVMTVKYNKVMQPEHHSYTYKFTNNRVGRIRGLDRETKVPDLISVHSIKAMSAEQFAKSYRAVSAAEMQAAKEALNEMTGRDKKGDAESKTKQAAGNSMLNMFNEISQAWEPVAGIGDEAHWNRETRDLAVLQNGVKFELKAEISNDNEKNKSVAVELAQLILAKCN